MKESIQVYGFTNWTNGSTVFWNGEEGEKSMFEREEQ